MTRTASPIFCRYLSRVRIICVIVCICILSNLAAPLGAEAAGKANLPLCPLVLISEPVKDAKGSIERSLWAKSGLIKGLESSGYKLGQNLFVHIPGKPYSDLMSGAQAVREVLSRIVAGTGCENLDVAAYGVSGLVLRFGLEIGIIRDGLINNAIMLNAPQRGSFLADFLLQICKVVEHESVFEQETRKARFSPFGEVGGPLDPNAILAKSKGDLPASIGTSSFSWESEAWWVAKRALEIYEPLYSKYVQERFLSIPYVPIDSPKQTFAGWIKDNRPLIWENCIAQGHDSPFGPISDTELKSQPRKGQDFSIAYYELVAMAVGRNQYVVRMASRGSLVKSLFTEQYVPTSPKDAALHYGLKALVHYAKKALITVKAEVQKLVTDAIAGSVGYLDGPDSRLLRTLVKEDILVNMGTSAGQRFYRVRANNYLKSINQKSASEFLVRKTRFASLTGRVTNLLSIAWPQLGPNNLFCEVDCAVSPQGPRDIVRVFSGFLSPSYLDLLKDKRVQQSIISLLSEPGPMFESTVKHNERKPIEVSSWHPSYVSVLWEESQSQVFNVSIDVPSAPEGWGYLIWIEGHDGSHWLPVPGWNRLLAGATVVEAMLKNPSYRIGVRLVRQGALNPYTPGGKVESVFEKEVKSKVLAAAASSSGIDSDEGLKCPDGRPLEEGTVSSLLDPTSGLPNSGGTYQPEEGLPEHPGAGNEDIPTVRVVYRSKHTTLRKPSQVYHSYWEADFGDGDTAVVQGQPDLVISHTFDPYGPYQVRLTSYDNNDNVLIEKTWNVVTPGPEQVVREFKCRSVIPPEVELELAGPQKWVTGKHALFGGKVAWALPEGAQVIDVDCDPGEKFQVLWERSGEFTVFWAVTLTISYELDGKTLNVKNTYVTSKPVNVFTSGITQ